METDGDTALEATARWTAAVRAQESERADPLLHDPWAAELAGEQGRAWLAGRTAEGVLPIVLRSRYFDDWLARIAAEDPLRQFVLLGAGLDTRAYRLAWPAGSVLFELDRAAVLARKALVMDAARAVARTRRVPVGADLEGGWSEALTAAGMDPACPTAWLLEGLLFYLPTPLGEAILHQVSALSATGSRLGFDVVNAATLTSPYTRPWVEMQAAAGAPWLGTMEDPVGFLAALGWQASLSQAGQPDAHHGRWTLPVLPTSMPGVPHDWFVTAVRSG